MAKLTNITQEMGRDAGKFLKSVQWYAKPFEVGFLLPNIIPTGLRYFGHADFGLNTREVKNWAIAFGIGANLAGYTLLAAVLDKPESLYIPLLTNAASLVYEWGRDANERVESKRVYH